MPEELWIATEVAILEVDRAKHLYVDLDTAMSADRRGEELGDCVWPWTNKPRRRGVAVTS
jgi:hypothetical protein